MLSHGNGPAMALVALYGAYALIVASVSSAKLPVPTGGIHLLALFVAGLCMPFGLWLLWRLAKERPESPFALARDMFRSWNMGERLVVGAPMIIAIGVFGDLFSAMKSSIPAVRPYWFDKPLADFEHSLFGTDAWRLLQPVLGHPFVDLGLNLSYHIWAAGLFTITIIAIAWIERPHLRRQFLLAYLLSWILLGTILATFLASVGPCFYEAFYGDRRFEPLMDYLHQTSKVVWMPALDVQQLLLDWYRSGEYGLGRGISAMPSMHVSIAVLFALYGWRAWPPLAWVGVPFLALIVLGSVHLGYHYALDGIVSIALTPVIWWISGRVLRAPAAAVREAEPAAA
jgi:hypothetical protein